jgi:hypothetical protein
VRVCGVLVGMGGLADLKDEVLQSVAPRTGARAPAVTPTAASRSPSSEARLRSATPKTAAARCSCSPSTSGRRSSQEFATESSTRANPGQLLKAPPVHNREGGPGEDTSSPGLTGRLSCPRYRGAGGAPMPGCQGGAPYGRTTLTATSGRRWPTAHNFTVPGAQRAGKSQVGMAVGAG